jgi:anaerobic selenocysteine-containing dehydrogenase
MGEKTRHPSICRFCSTNCPVIVEIEDGRPVRVTGNDENPSYHGFCCSRGLAVPEQFENPERLIHPVKRNVDGAYVQVASEQAVDEIAQKIRQIVAIHGPRSIAFYLGTYSGANSTTGPLMAALCKALGTPMVFTAATIDQPGKDIALALLGGWEAGPQVFSESDVWMIFGGNALISISTTIPGQNVGKRLTDALARGMKLIVVDPRRTQTAVRAQIHLQPRPGEDAAILAGMIHVILKENLHDIEFLGENAIGLDELRSAVEPFDPIYAAARADIPVDDLVTAARVFAGAKRGIAIGATGVNMSGRSSLTEYLILALNTICGRYVRAGEKISNPGVLLPRAMPKAQPRAPRPARDLGVKLSARGLGLAASGMPTAALADEILAGEVKALISVGGNPAVAWPDQKRTLAALEALELFVQLDIKMSASAKLAHYVIASKISFEFPTASHQKESMEQFSPVNAIPEPMGMYAPALVEPPPGSDALEEWEFAYGIAQRLGLALELTFYGGGPGTTRQQRAPISLDMSTKPTTDQLLEFLTNGSRVPLSEVKRHPNGALFPEEIFVAPKDLNCNARMNVGDVGMMQELDECRRDPIGERERNEEFPYLLICRRLAHVYNSSGRDLPFLTRRGRYNPAYMHPADLAQLGLSDGDDVRIESAHGAVAAIAEADPSLRRGLVSISHAFGDIPSAEADVRKVGSNTSVLLSVEDDYDRYSGIPRMSAVGVRVIPVTS